MSEICNFKINKNIVMKKVNPMKNQIIIVNLNNIYYILNTHKLFK